MKLFREPNAIRTQLFLMAQCVDDFVAPDAFVRVLDAVVDTLDLSDLLRRYQGGGAPAYHPRMLVKLLLFAYSQGLRSSRRIAELCQRDLWCMFLCEMQTPDFRTIARFRRDNEATFKRLFEQTVHTCQQQGLVLLEHVAIDGTKIEADVSAKRTYTAERAEKEVADAQAAIERILAEAEAADAQEERSQDPPPSAPDNAGKVQRLRRRKEQAQAAVDELKETKRTTLAATDPDSRVMKTRAGNRPAYNAQAAVDDAHGVIVAAVLTQDVNDGAQLPQMVPAIAETTGCLPSHVTADTGYSTPETLAAMEETGVDAYIAQPAADKASEDFTYDVAEDQLTRTDPETGEKTTYRFYRERSLRKKTYRVYRDAKNGKERWFTHRPDQEMARKARMYTKLHSAAGKAIYRKRQETVEPVFGHLKTRCCLRRFLLRGKGGASTEFLLACSAHNLLKLASSASLSLSSSLLWTLQTLLLQLLVVCRRPLAVILPLHGAIPDSAGLAVTL